jgi:hypothetical protein
MPGWASHNVGERVGNSWREQLEKLEARRLANRARKERERREFLAHLSKQHALRMNVPLAAAERVVNAVSVVARKPVHEEADAYE